MALRTSRSEPAGSRVTVHDALLPADKLQRLIDLLADHGAEQVMLQRCGTQHMLDPGLGDNSGPWRQTPRCSADQWQGGPISAKAVEPH